MTLGEKIQDLRRRNAMSQDALAEKLEISRQAVSKWERDEAMPETDKIIRIAQVFGVSTDYLLMDEPPQPQPQPQSHHSRARSWENRIERIIRRHGYKAGYALIAWGSVLCVIALLVMILVPALASGFLEAGKIPQNDANQGIYVEGDLPQDVLDDIYGQAGSGMSGGIFGGMEELYNQQVDQMNQVWQTGVRIITAIFGVPMMLIGIALITAGVIVIRKGKKHAQQVQ